ncbi:MAG: glycine--tRNA ligase [Candidatus Thermoplasmatota archaeon]|nr:glycine--tRNA ligase [Candidatus Thermoplasmatota archaeon]
MTTYEEAIELAKRRGFFWPSFSIYGGQSGFYDYGPLGVLLRENIVKVWRDEYLRSGAIFIDTPNLSPEMVFRASGHLEKFSDLAARCSKCGSRYKLESLLGKAGIADIPADVKQADNLLENISIKCEKCGAEIKEVYNFNLMFALEKNEKEASRLYLRPETAQGIFINFRLLNNYFRGKLPMAVGQLGKGFRNEISPRNALIRLREFYQGEVEVFYDPEKPGFADIPVFEETTFLPMDHKEKRMTVREASSSGLIRNPVLAHFVFRTQKILWSIGLGDGVIRFRQHEKNELAHYSSDCWDAEAKLEDEWVEIVGISDRATYDLKRHAEFSGENMVITDGDRKFIPSVVEPSFGIDRTVLSIIMTSLYTRENGSKVLGFNTSIAPYIASVLPLQKKDGVDALAKDIYSSILEAESRIQYDESGSIGRRYARQDEVGTPYCITVDYESLEDRSVTVRERDSTKQVRIGSDSLKQNSGHLDAYLDSLFA